MMAFVNLYPMNHMGILASLRPRFAVGCPGAVENITQKNRTVCHLRERIIKSTGILLHRAAKISLFQSHDPSEYFHIASCK